MSVKLLDFYADWCGPCKQQDPILDELEDEYEGRVEFEKVDIEEDTDRVNQFNVQSVPTLVLLADDEVADRFVGVQPKDVLEDAIEAAL